MPDSFVVELPISEASVQQFCSLVSYVAELAGNLFFAGGSAVTFKVGHNEKRGLEEFWVPTPDAKADEVILHALCDRSPLGACGPDVNVFVNPIWPLTMDRRAITIAEALALQMQGLPAYVALLGYSPLEVSDRQPYYVLQKALASIFALAVNRGATEVGFVLQRGQPVSREERVSRVEYYVRKVKEPVRDEAGHAKFLEVKDPSGHPVMEIVYDKRSGRPLVDGKTGEIRKKPKVVYEEHEVDQRAQRVVEEVVSVSVTPIYLQVVTVPPVEHKDFVTAAQSVAAYDPTWMLLDVLAGKCRDKKPYQTMGGKP